MIGASTGHQRINISLLWPAMRERILMTCLLILLVPPSGRRFFCRTAKGSRPTSLATCSMIFSMKVMPSTVPDTQTHKNTTIHEQEHVLHRYLWGFITLRTILQGMTIAEMLPWDTLSIYNSMYQITYHLQRFIPFQSLSYIWGVSLSLSLSLF